MRSGQPLIMDETSIHLRAAIQGDAQSLEWVIVHFGPLLQAQVRFRLGESANEADLEDVVADVWLTVLSRIGDLQAREGHLAPVLAKFLSTTTLFKANHLLRRRIRQAGRTDGDRDPEEPVADPLDDIALKTRGILTHIQESETWSLVTRALHSLSEARQRVLVLRLLEQRSNKEIAEILDLRPNTVAVQYRRGVQELREHLPASIFGELRHLTKVPLH